MKAFIITLGIVFCILAGFLGYRFLLTQSLQKTPSTVTTEKTGTVTESGVVQKLPKPGDDYTHMLRTSGGMIRLNSY